MTDYSPGLAGIPAARSSISYLDGIKGVLEYRGIPIGELAQNSTFLETAYLLIFGKLPSQNQINLFTRDVADHRRIKFRIRDLIKCLPEGGHPMDALQAAVAALGMFYPAKNVQDEKVQYISTVRLLAKLPTIVAAHARMRHGDDPILPRDGLSHAANFLYMLTGREPDPPLAKAIDTCLILHAEHTMNASTFSGMVTASTLSDAYTVVSSAVGTLRGPLHGGANQAVLEMLREVGSVDNVKPFVEKRLKSGQKIMGFGHREYKVKDVRAGILQKVAEQLFGRYGRSPHYEIALEMEKVVTSNLGHKRVYPNVDFYSGIVYEKLGIDSDLFTPVFAMARVSGWLAHWIEQLKNNHIFRPTEIYEGAREMAYTPIEHRS